MGEIGDKKRLFIYIIFLAVLVIPIILRLGYLMVILPPEEVTEPSVIPTVERGPILDRNGKILAIQTRVNSIAAAPPLVSAPNESAAQLGEILSLDPVRIASLLKKESQFVWIKRKVTTTESRRIEALLGEGSLKGITLIPESARSYPKQELASQTIGFVGLDNVGLEGLEWFFNKELSPSQSDPLEERVYGNQVFLTLDLNAQYIIREAALEAYEENQADFVMIMVMDAKNGDILGSTSYPDYNPNSFNRYSAESRANRPFTFAYEPGSVFKIFSLASFLELGGITRDNHFFCNGFYDAVHPRITCLGVHEDVTPQRIIQYSCNVGAAFASENVSKIDYYKMLLKFGFGKPTGIEFPGESSGILSSPDNWSARSKPTIAFGQEISVSAIQVLTAATAFTNDGVLLQPHIIEKIVSPAGEVLKENRREPLRQVISEDTAREVLLMMETATAQGGTAYRASIDGLRISAKTGTAQVRDDKTGNYSADHYIASFLGIFPTNDPQLIAYVVINYPKGDSYYGSRLGAPVFKKITEKLVKIMDIRGFGDKERLTHSGELKVRLPAKIDIGEEMPDLMGLPKRSLMTLFRDSAFFIDIQGTGFVVRQSPSAGTPLTGKTKIVLELE